MKGSPGLAPSLPIPQGFSVADPEGWIEISTAIDWASQSTAAWLPHKVDTDLDPDLNT